MIDPRSNEHTRRATPEPGPRVGAPREAARLTRHIECDGGDEAADRAASRAASRSTRSWRYADGPERVD